MQINGQRGAFLQPRRWGRSESGNFESYFYHGTQEEVQAQAAAWASVPGLLYEVTEGFGGLSRLEIKFPWNQDGLVNPATDFIETWELFAQEHEKDLLESQDNGGLVASISLEQKTIIRDLINNPPSPSTGDSRWPVAEVDFEIDDNQQPIPGNGPNAFMLYTLMQSGMRSFIMPAPALRKTLITSLSYALGFALTDVRRLLSTATLLTIEDVPGNLLFNVANYTAGDISTDPLLAYGWWKGFPTIQQIALQKWQLVQEWRYGWWPVAVYGNPL